MRGWILPQTYLPCRRLWEGDSEVYKLSEVREYSVQGGVKRVAKIGVDLGKQMKGNTFMSIMALFSALAHACEGHISVKEYLGSLQDPQVCVAPAREFEEWTVSLGLVGLNAEW